MVSNRVGKANQEHKERTCIHAALAAFQQVESGQSVLREDEFDPLANRFFSTGDAVYGASTGIQTLVREGYSLERPIPSLRTNTSYILASLGAEVIEGTSSVDTLLESPAQDLQHRIGLLAEQLLYRQMDYEDRAMTQLCDGKTNLLPTVQYERTVLSALLEEFSIIDSPDLHSALASHNSKMREYATLCLENAASHALGALKHMLDNDTSDETYKEAKAAFGSLYSAWSEMYGMQLQFKEAAEQYTKAVHAAAVDYITGELETYRELIETAKKMSGGDREELTEAIRAITSHEEKMRTAFRRTHEFLSSAAFKEYTQQYSALQNDEGYSNLTTEISGPHYFDNDFAEAAVTRSRITAITPSDQLTALAGRRYDDTPTVIRAPRAVEAQLSF